ncbi:hypothetical protein F5Y09DRAFT_16083 [Xylaria sp. FL1042]|nr:hypothetical protein F5Y09DRAFT_16083 [Xylaria sp. FL1042]
MYQMLCCHSTFLICFLFTPCLALHIPLFVNFLFSSFFFTCIRASSLSQNREALIFTPYAPFSVQTKCIWTLIGRCTFARPSGSCADSGPSRRPFNSLTN